MMNGAGPGSPVTGRLLMQYEDGMQIIWDVVSRQVVVIFRGDITSLPQKFQSRAEGIAAGEEFCRDAGWTEVSTRKTGPAS